MKRFLSTPFLSSLVSTILIKLIYETRVRFRHYIYVRVSYIKIVFVWLKLTLLYWSIHKLELKWAVHIKKELCKQFLSFQVSCFKNHFAFISLLNWHHFFWNNTKRSILLSKHYGECSMHILLTLIYKYSTEASIAETWFEIVEMLKTANKVIFLCPEF